MRVGEITCRGMPCEEGQWEELTFHWQMEEGVMEKAGEAENSGREAPFWLFLWKKNGTKISTIIGFHWWLSDGFHCKE